MAYGEPDDVTKAVDDAESKVFKVAEDRVTDSTQLLSESIKGVMDRLEETYARGDIITGTATGYHDLDELLSGLQPSTLNIVGARPAMGKTASAWAWRRTSPRPRPSRCSCSRWRWATTS